MDRLLVMDEAIDNVSEELHKKVGDWYEREGREYYENMGLFERVEFENFMANIKEMNSFCQALYLAMTSEGVSHEVAMEALHALLFSWPED